VEESVCLSAFFPCPQGDYACLASTPFILVLVKLESLDNAGRKYSIPLA
jgi:hypothetical protein